MRLRELFFAFDCMLVILFVSKTERLHPLLLFALDRLVCRFLPPRRKCLSIHLDLDVVVFVVCTFFPSGFFFGQLGSW